MPEQSTDVEELRELVEGLASTAAELRERGEAADIPAVERNAKRVEDAVAMLELNVPPELDDE